MDVKLKYHVEFWTDNKETINIETINFIYFSCFNEFFYWLTPRDEDKDMISKCLYI